MANRAYLYSGETNESFDWRERNAVPYYDSRHGIPLAWFFFFQTADIRMIDVKGDSESEWQEVKLAAIKSEALELFKKRQPILMEIVAPRLEASYVEHLLNDVTDWPGQYLLMNPVEVAEDDENDARRFAEIFAVIESNPSNLTAILEAAAFYTRVDDVDKNRLILNMVGATYWR